MVKQQPVLREVYSFTLTAPAASLPEPSRPSCCLTCCLLQPAMRSRSLMSLYVCVCVVFVCDGGEGGGVSEPALVRVPLEAWLCVFL